MVFVRVLDSKRGGVSVVFRDGLRMECEGKEGGFGFAVIWPTVLSL